MLTREELDHIGSLVTIKDSNTCLGALWVAEGHGVYDPQFGKIPLTEEEAKTHNEAYDKALLEGLDKNCAVGQKGCFYFNEAKRRVGTFFGTVVAEGEQVKIRGISITFNRNGKVYRGRLRQTVDLFTFKRIK